MLVLKAVLTTILKSSRSHFAEREGFEPPEQLPVHRISSAARSTTPASLLVVLALITVCKSTMFVRNDQTSSRDSVFWACILWEK